MGEGGASGPPWVLAPFLLVVASPDPAISLLPAAEAMHVALQAAFRGTKTLRPFPGCRRIAAGDECAPGAGTGTNPEAGLNTQASRQKTDRLAYARADAACRGIVECLNPSLESATDGYLTHNRSSGSGLKEEDRLDSRTKPNAALKIAVQVFMCKQLRAKHITESHYSHI